MDGTKSEATYKPISEIDMEEEAVARSKAGLKVKSDGKADGADEKMLPEDEKRAVINASLYNSDLKNAQNEKQNGDAKLDIGEPEPVSVFGGMDKDELMKYANDPFWVRLRWFLFIGFWTLWAAMLLGAVMIIYAAPKCEPPPPMTWWQEGPLTELPIETDPGLLKTLDSAIKGVIIPWVEDAYSVVNESHNILKLIKEAKQKGTKTIIELDPSTSFKWFSDSEAGKEQFIDYYIWRAAKSTGNGGIPEPPNNWISINNNSSWMYSYNRKQFYYSPLGVPLLNFRNNRVIEEFSQAIKTFLDHGAAGIRIRNTPFLLVDSKFEDEVIISNTLGVDHKEYGFFTHTKTENVADLGVLLNAWKKVVRNKTEDGPFMVSEELGKMQSYKVNDSLVVDLPLKARVFDKMNVSDIVNNLNHTFNIDNVEWPLWRVNKNTTLPSDVLDIITYLLPGTRLVEANASINAHLLKIRQSPSVMRGICSIHNLQNNTFAYIRVTTGNPGVLVAVNLLDTLNVVNFREQIPALSELEEVTLQLHSNNYNESDITLNKKIDATRVPISPKAAVVLSYVPKKKE